MKSLSGIHDNQPLAHGIVGHRNTTLTHMALSTTAPALGGPMLIDTGAQVSLLDLSAALELGLPETDMPIAIAGVAGTGLARRFTGVLHLPQWNITVAMTFASLPLREQQEQGLLGIIGMDLLSEFILILDGPNRSIALRPPADL